MDIGNQIQSTCTPAVSKICFIIISGYLAAQKDLWIIGDVFVNEMFHILQELKDNTGDNHNHVPYLYDYYNITHHTDDLLAVDKGNSLVRILNAIIEPLNTTAPMPRIMLVMPDFDILRQIKNFGFGVSQVIGTLLNWLINNIE